MCWTWIQIQTMDSGWITTNQHHGQIRCGRGGLTPLTPPPPKKKYIFRNIINRKYKWLNIWLAFVFLLFTEQNN